MTERRPTVETRAGSKGLRSGGSEAVRVKLLGGFSTSVGSRTIQHNEWRLRKAAALIKVLALAPGHRLHREQAMDLLWPDSGRKAASNNLRQALYAARRILAASPAGSRCLISEDESLIMCPGGELWVDVEAFEEAATTARRAQEPAAYRTAIELYAGELLPVDRYEEWAEEHRRRLREMHLSLLLGLARLSEEHADYDSAIEALRRVVAEEPTREEAHADLMRLYALSGSKEEALARYGRLEEILARELGTEPAASSRALREEIAAGRFPLQEAPSFGSPPKKPPGVGKHNVPAARTSFVGQEREIVELKRELAMTRLLTLTGAGGSGKTRLALEVARDLVGAYADGVWLVELAPLSDGKLVPQVVARAMRVREQPGRPLADTLTEALHKKATLLVLDNCEHLADSVAHLVDTLLDSCSRLRVLTTSREPLEVEGEAVWRVSSLSTPDTDRLPAAGELMRYDAVRLFLDRARLRMPHFDLTPANTPAVAEVCTKLEGIPLAIELGAARMGTLSVWQISEKLRDPLSLLSAGRRTAVPRHKTLRGTLDWSHDLLSESERTLFGRLSVFAGGWMLEAAEAVVAGDGIEEDAVLDLLSRLVDKSLVTAEIPREGGPRYTMLEPVRQYAQEKLEESGEAQATKRAHAEYFLALAEEAEPRLWGPGDAAWLNRLKEEHYNMRAALSWTIEHEEAELALRLSGALRWFWRARGYFGEGRRWLEQALSEEGRTSAGARAKALDGVGWLASEQSDIDRVEGAAVEGLKLSDEAGIGGVITADFKNLLGEAAWLRGDNERAAELFNESLVIHREARNSRGVAWSVCSLAAVSSDRGDYERAKEFYEEGIALAREMGGALPLGDLLISLGYVYLLEGDHKRATALNEEAAELYRKRGSRGSLRYAIDNLGWAALVREDHERAKALHEESLVLCKEIGDKVIGSESLEGLACSAASRGEAQRAARLFGAAQALREAVGAHQTSRERSLREPYLTIARARPDEAAWETAFAEGQAMSFEEAVEHALSAEELSPPAPPAPEQPSTGLQQRHLTRREKEVAALVAQGLTNRQIASELVLSEHTVHHHVTNVLKKLDLRSREQVASRLGGS